MTRAVFTLPDLGEGLQEAEIVAWHVAPGDHVVADQPIVSVETEKAVVEVPSPQAGRIAEIFAAAGQKVRVGAPLLRFVEGAEADTGAVVGSLPQGAAPPRPVAAAPTATPAIAAMPAARARAQALGLDLATLRGSGPGGTITLADVEAAAGSRGEELRGVRLAMARNMAAFRDSVAPTTVCDDADVTGWAPDAEVTLRLARAVAAGCRAAPSLNAWLEGEPPLRRLHAAVDLGIAVDTGDGLFVPVLRDVGGRDDAALRADFAALKAAVRSRAAPPAMLRGATVTLSNFGTMGGRYAALAVVPPQVAILGAGRIDARPAVHDGALAVRRLLPLSLTFDHRAVTGGEAARFLAAAIAELEKSE
ncbi:dihydrolipoamide acetyltransferase family protein [Neoroseomonas oryzicola]|uniref:Dihydrolipoamide acetyltransferase component of pyruvate dehydrogenase complex n=1 Tax=Neoroseomonas oryzicola TaxID=535904 RepID=A0A9X9WDL8_9PROT|nr:dihydrolipoamide acetyltransferase family protein [Neoroseomonas oryzicola]MBR0658428.1 2-oxo acid dehydrogenase subunit E2 [Neoroseomonas oryzicola]NKE17617.1 2-oxo acid dehydrogenase subunit E2 [Neoroseomonas oryzicola]